MVSPASPLGTAPSLERDELKGFSRTVAEIEWLLLILVLLYLVVSDPQEENRSAIYMALMFFAAFVLSFRYTNFYQQESRWKLAIETWVMIVFITWVMWHTGRLESPLLNLYLLTIIISALTLGKLVTLLEMALIASCYVLIGHSQVEGSIFSLAYGAQLMGQLAPMVLVAYLTTMLSADIRYAISRIRVLSETDDLTGVLNMRAFSTILEREAGLSSRYSRPYSILMVDSDNLKSVNDTFGHEAGNNLLIHLVRSVQQALRATDVLARFGGDEFVVLLPETSTDHAREVAERVRIAVEGAPLDVRGTRVLSTVSIGIANFPEDAQTPEAVLEKADKAMYQSKQMGRNCASSFGAG
ncbi:MAG: GGDEF domain-containing protein [Betaproteobacteria bacterium]|nr:GGDEF domain-containing protein [Betaproteobacteria bacterium]